MSDWSNFNEQSKSQINEWTADENTDLYKNIDYKNEWLDDDKKNEIYEEQIENEDNILYDKLNLKFESFFNGPKLFHKEQTRRRKNN